MDFLNKLKGCRVRIVQVDNFTKDGILEDYDDMFISIRFNDGSTSLIRIDKIIEIKEVDGNARRRKENDK